MPWKTVVQGAERSALGRVALAHHLGQAKDPELTAHGAEPATCLHRGELAGVADGDDLRARLLGRLEYSRAAAGGGHPCLVENENASLWQLIAELLKVDQQPVERARCDPGLARRARARRGPWAPRRAPG